MKLWQSDDLIALLAWVDLCIKLEMDFDSTIEEHLNRWSKEPVSHEPFTVEQAKRKLTDTARAYRESDTLLGPSRSEILKSGSSSIPGLPVDLREEIEKATKEYERNNLAGRLRVISIPRDALDRTKELDILNSNCLNSTGKMNTNIENTLNDNTMTTLALDHKLKIAKRAEIMEPAPLQRRVQCESVSSPKSALWKANTIKDRHIAQMASKEDEIKKLRLKWQEETYELAQQQSKNAQTTLELRAQLKHREMAKKACEEAGKNPMEETMFQYMHQNWSLLQRVQEMKKQLGFCQRTPDQSKEWIQQCIRERMATMESEMTDLLHGHNHNASLMVPVIQRESDLGCLIRSVFGMSSGEEIALFRRCIAKYGSEPEVIVSTFVSAALKEWVFLSNFPGFATRNQLLDSYRKVVIVNDGWKSAHNLEVAAYQSLMDETSFKSTVIPKLASELAARLSKALAPLFSIQAKEVSVDPSWWGQHSDVVVSRNFRLIELFSTALDLKAKTVLAENSFEFVVYPPGTKRRANSSEETVRECQASEQHHSWIYSSLHMYGATVSVPLDSTADAVLTPRNFVKKAAQDREVEGLYEATVCISSLGPRIPSNADTLSRAETRIPSSREEDSNPERNSGFLGLKQSKRNVMTVDTGTDDIESSNYTENEDLTDQLAQTFVCHKCEAIFQSRRARDSHNHKYTCGLCSGCGTICQNKQRFLQHRKNHHPNTTNVVFDIAWKSDKSRLQNNVGNDKPSSIIRNERRSSGNEDTRCSKESREQRPVQQSRPEHSNKPKTRLVAAPGGACNKCGKLFAYPGSLDKHVREEACGECLECNVWFKTRDLLLAHNVATHGALIAEPSSASDTPEGDIFASDISDGEEVIPSPSPTVNPRKRTRCSTEEITTSSLDREGGKVYECAMCMETFPNPWSREDHSRSHACDLEGHRASKDDIVDDTSKATCRQCGTMFTPPPFHKRRRLSQNSKLHPFEASTGGGGGDGETF